MSSWAATKAQIPEINTAVIDCSQPVEPEPQPGAYAAISPVDIIPADDAAEWPGEQALSRWAMAAIGDNSRTIVIKLVSVDEMIELNRVFAGQEKPTNVLSFPADELTPPITLRPAMNELKLPAVSLGDIAICASVVASEAAAQGKTQLAHWAHMVVHGVLHLRGFDHIDDADAMCMEAEEKMILESLGFPDPYRVA